jgi:hypothetical protein
MNFKKRCASACIGAAFGLAIASAGSVASAADMAPIYTKAPPPTPWVLDVHGYFDVTFANTRVTGSGLLLYPTGSALVQPSMGLALDIYKDPSTFINSFTVFGSLWNEFYTDPHDLQAQFRHWQEMDWSIGFSVGFAKYWKFSYNHVEFLFPWDGTAFNDIFNLAFDDSFLGLPITFNPYIQMFYNERGGSLVIFGKRDHIERFDVGIVPTLSLMKYTGIPLTFTAPIWLDFGPSSFWNRNDGTTNFCGPASNAPCALSNLGYFTAGLQAKYTLEQVVPKRLGVWYIKGGVQWYHILNDALLAAQQAGQVVPGPQLALVGTGVVPFFPQAKRDVAVWTTGFGFSF